MDHKYAQVLRWIADGSKINLQDPATKKIYRVLHEDVLRWIGMGICPDPMFFSLAPRTVKVGDVEIEAPLDDVEFGSSYWVWDEIELEACVSTNDLSVYDARTIAAGKAFSSAEAAQAAHAAWVKLMKGE